MTTTPLRSSAASNDPDQLSGRIARLRARQKLADEEQAEIDRERWEIAHCNVSPWTRDRLPWTGRRSDATMMISHRRGRGELKQPPRATIS